MEIVLMRKVDGLTNLKSSKLSISYWLPDEDRRIQDSHDSHFYPSMLVEDIHSGIMPWKEYTVTADAMIKPHSEVVEPLVIAALISELRTPQNLYSTIRDFVDEAAHVMASVGEVYYEIVYFTEGEKNNPVAFEFHLLPTGVVKEKREVYRQYIPQKVVNDLSLKRGYVDIPKDLIINIRMPKNTIKSSQFRRLLKNLKQLSTTSMPPDFAISEIVQPSAQNIFSLDYFRKVHDLTIAKETMRIGWFARSLLDERVLQFYSILRFLRFHKFKAMLRETIICAINDALTKVGKKMGFVAEIEISGLLSSGEIVAIEDELMHGKIEFTAVYNRIFTQS
jgi:hypothetical protein